MRSCIREDNGMTRVKREDCALRSELNYKKQATIASCTCRLLPPAHTTDTILFCFGEVKEGPLASGKVDANRQGILIN